MFPSQFRHVSRSHRRILQQKASQQFSVSLPTRRAVPFGISFRSPLMQVSKLLVLTLAVAFAMTNGVYAFAAGSGTTSSSIGLSQISCGTQSLTGAQSKACSVYLTSTVSTSTVVTMRSNNSALNVPSSVTVLAGTRTGGFKIVASAVTKSVGVTITGTEGGVTKTDVITLYPVQAPPTSSATVSKVSCGSTTLTGPTTKACSVYLNRVASISTVVTLSSNNAALHVQASVTVPAGSSAAGFGITALAVLTTQSATLTAHAGGASQSDVLQLLGSGSQGTTPHHVSLTWSAPSSNSPAVVGYNVYRALAGSSYARLNSASDSSTGYIDSTVQNGKTYDYEVRSVDAAGVESRSSNQTSVTIP